MNKSMLERLAACVVKQRGSISNAQTTSPSQAHSASTQPPPRQSSILVVDDDAAVRKSLARVLTAENYLTLLARNGKEALEIVANNRVDLIMLDLNMPVKDGWQTFSRLSFEHPTIPIFIITARPNQLFSALAAGVAGLMEKPLDFPKLLQTIGALLSEPAETRLA